MSIWKAIVTAEVKQREVSITFKDGKIVDGVVIWCEGSNDSESGRDEGAIEIDGNKSMFFFLDEIETVTFK